MWTRCQIPLLVIGAILLPVPVVWADPVCLPNGTVLAEVDFERHVASVLSRSGCNAGSCHGSFQGKGGLFLSLFGSSPAKDYLALARDGLGRRVNKLDPAQSLMLLKPTQQVPHEGGQRFAKDSWQYHVLREWIAQGCRWSPGSGAVRHVEVQPAEHRFEKTGETLDLKVVVDVADGKRVDVTPFCDFRVKDDSIAEASPTGRVRALQGGDTPVIVSYRGHLASTRVLVPEAIDNSLTYPALPEVNYIDREVFARLRLLNIVPSDLSSDAEFLRRVTIDTIGCLPTPAEVRAFLADQRSDRRERKIDALLAHPLHAALWATKLCDVTGNNLDALEGPAEVRPKRAKMFHDWFRKRIAENQPYDQIVKGVLCATSRDDLDLGRWIQREAALVQRSQKGFTSDYADRKSLDLFWRRTTGEEFFPLEQMAELTASAFLGVRLECAQCHKHPYDRWTQTDYRAFANVFAQTKFDNSPELRAATADLLAARRDHPERAGPPIPRLREVFVSNHPLRRLANPESNRPLPPRALGGREFDYQGDAREKLFRWLVEPDNPFFARNFVNRVWALYFGAGIVEPVDNFSLANPPTNARLLDALARDFHEHGYDIRRLERILLLSRTYQLGSVPNASNGRDRHNFARSYVRRLPAEVVVDVLNAALDVHEDFGPDLPPGIHAIEIAPSRVRDRHLAQVFRIFGRPARTTSCDCERSMEPAVPQTLFLMSDARLLKTIPTGRLKRLLAEKRTDDEIVEELFLATLSRLPDPQEKQDALQHVRGREDRQAAFTAVVWALLNTREFITNH